MYYFLLEFRTNGVVEMEQDFQGILVALRIEGPDHGHKLYMLILTESHSALYFRKLNCRALDYSLFEIWT